MRLNEDGKLIIYNQENNIYLIEKTQFVGIEKFYYLYFWAESKVSRKVKDFIYKLYTYKTTPEIKQKFSHEIILSVMSYIKRNP